MPALTAIMQQSLHFSNLKKFYTFLTLSIFFYEIEVFRETLPLMSLYTSALFLKAVPIAFISISPGRRRGNILGLRIDLSPSCPFHRPLSEHLPHLNPYKSLGSLTSLLCSQGV
jgi:hypothetical protein